MDVSEAHLAVSFGQDGYDDVAHRAELPPAFRIAA